MCRFCRCDTALRTRVPIPVKAADPSELSQLSRTALPLVGFPVEACQRYDLLSNLILQTRLLRPHKHKCHTVTFDNGKEFAEHETIAAELNADVLFRPPLPFMGTWC
jgi:hypothetical protein